MATIQTGDDLFGVAKWIVDPTAGAGTHTTIQSAINSASSGDTVFIRANTSAYTENLTLKAGVNLSAFTCDAFTPNVIISGKCSMTTAGTVSISGIQLQSNGAEFLSVTGSAASIVDLIDCVLNTAFDPGITFSSSSASAQINISYCDGNITTSGKKFFAHSSAGLLDITSSYISNTGSSTTASTCSAGSLLIFQSNFASPIVTSGTSSIICNSAYLDCGSLNATPLTIGGSNNGSIYNSVVLSGTASAISISSAFNVYNNTISSSNTNAITGVGAISYSGLSFASTSSTINTTTQTVSGTIQGSKNTAPTAGMIGQRIENTATSVATTSTVSKTIASVALTPGIWDLGAMAASVPTGGTALMTVQIVNISTTDNTLTGTLGIDYIQINCVNSAGQVLSGSVPSYRVTISTNTTFYLVVNNTYTSTTCPTNGRISATRVG